MPDNSNWQTSLKVPWNALKHEVLFCVDVILTESGRQGGTYQAAPPLFKIAIAYVYITAWAKAVQSRWAL